MSFTGFSSLTKCSLAEAEVVLQKLGVTGNMRVHYVKSIDGRKVVVNGYTNEQTDYDSWIESVYESGTFSPYRHKERSELVEDFINSDRLAVARLYRHWISLKH